MLEKAENGERAVVEFYESNLATAIQPILWWTYTLIILIKTWNFNHKLWEGIAVDIISRDI